MQEPNASTPVSNTLLHVIILHHPQALDLHGLHIAEAVALLEDELPKLCSAGLQAVSLITGSGHHSRGSNYKVRSA